MYFKIQKRMWQTCDVRFFIGVIKNPIVFAKLVAGAAYYENRHFTPIPYLQATRLQRPTMKWMSYEEAQSRVDIIKEPFETQRLFVEADFEGLKSSIPY